MRKKERERRMQWTEIEKLSGERERDELKIKIKE